VSHLRTLKPIKLENLKKPKNLKTFSKNLGLSSPAFSMVLARAPIALRTVGSITPVAAGQRFPLHIESFQQFCKKLIVNLSKDDSFQLSDSCFT